MQSIYSWNARILHSVYAEITRRASEMTFGRRAFEVIIAANVRVDAPKNQYGYDESHFDNNAFDKSRLCLEEERELIRPASQRGRAASAWRVLGRLTHSAHDFYAHSNYVYLWLACRSNGTVPDPSEIDPLDEAIIENPFLRSGEAYFTLGFRSFVPGLKSTVTWFMPPTRTPG